MTTITLDDIDTELTAELALLQPDGFTTLDIALHPRMRELHGVKYNALNYKGMVGKKLKRLQTRDGLPLLLEQPTKRKVGTTQTAVWRLAVARDVPMPTVRPRPAEVVTQAENLNLGPQYANDAPFTRRMRRHQSWYRTQVLGLPHGVGPQRGGAPYGNYLTEADAARGANFLTPAIHQVALDRLRERTGVVQEYRLLHNLLSSQPMCFNLFGPLVDDLGLATRLLGALLPGEVAQVERVLLEWAPQPARDFLSDRTAFDAFVEYRRPDGARAFVGFETKLTEPFSQDHYDGAAYRRWMDERAPWRPEAAQAVTHVRHNQLWRDHLLAVALARQPGWAHGRLALVRHPLDAECAEVVRGYTGLLREGDDTFADFTLDRVLDAWSGALQTEEERTWLAAFALRYLGLSTSGS
jgi:hypothetical protein